MKVKVSYTTDLRDVPVLIDDLLASMRDDLSQCITKFRFDPLNFEEMVRDLENAKDRLSVVESQIEDVLNIASGYLGAISPPEEHGSEAEEADGGTSD